MMEDYIRSGLTDALSDLVISRRSIRRYDGRPVEHSVLEELLTWAMWAPSAHNRQPWRFCVVIDAQMKQRMAESLGERWVTDLRTDGVADDVIERRLAASYERMTSAAALVILCMCMDDMDVYTDYARQAAERTMAVQGVAMAGQNLLLAAHAHGLGACWMCAPLFAPGLVRDTLELPASWEPQTLITLGYPAEERSSVREPLDSRVQWR